MIKFILAAIWLCAAAIGAVVYSYQFSQARQSEAPPPPFFGGLDYVKTGVISVPVLRDGTVGGYFIARLVYAVDPKELAKLTIPAPSIFLDEIYAYLFGNPEIDWSRRKTVDLDAFKAGIRDSINKEIGAELVHEVLIEQVDYLSKAEIRDNALRGRLAPDDAKAEEPAKTGGH